MDTRSSTFVHSNTASYHSCRPCCHICRMLLRLSLIHYPLDDQKRTHCACQIDRAYLHTWDFPCLCSAAVPFFSRTVHCNRSTHSNATHGSSERRIRSSSTSEHPNLMSLWMYVVNIAHEYSWTRCSFHSTIQPSKVSYHSPRRTENGWMKSLA